MEVDHIGSQKRIFTIEQFWKFYNENKDEIHKYRTKMLNNRFIIRDNDHFYKIAIRHDKCKLVRKCNDDCVTKREMINDIRELQQIKTQMEFIEQRLETLFNELTKVLSHLHLPFNDVCETNTDTTDKA